VKEVLLLNISNIIKSHVAENTEMTAIIFGERRISYVELDGLINRVAGGLLKLGLKRGDVFSFFLPSLPELIIGYLGTVRAGLTVNVVNAMLREQEVAYILRDCCTRAVLVDHKRLPIIKAVQSEVESLNDVIVLGKSGKDDYCKYESVLDSGNDQFKPVDVEQDDLCHLMYTSGTTGWPKGVMATHRNVWHNATFNVPGCVAGKCAPGQLEKNCYHTAPDIDTDKSIFKFGNAIVYPGTHPPGGPGIHHY
jgi:long-chain acyl-CoA synthetase